jgi:hypothetical protein
VLPEFVPARWWHHLFHNQRALLINGALLFRPKTVVTSVPFHLTVLITASQPRTERPGYKITVGLETPWRRPVATRASSFRSH